MHMFNIVRLLCSMNVETFLINKMSLPIFDFCRHKDSVIVHKFWEVFSLQKNGSIKIAVMRLASSCGE